MGLYVKLEYVIRLLVIMGARDAFLPFIFLAKAALHLFFAQIVSHDFIAFSCENPGVAEGLKHWCGRA